MAKSLGGGWKGLLAEPGEAGHIVQLYRDEEFYAEAISHFAAEGLAREESIILVATRTNWEKLSARLRGKGFDPDALLRQGQLTVLDADATLPRFMSGATPDGERFLPLARATIEKARGGGKFKRVRWWGEMVNVLYVNGNTGGSHRLEQYFDRVAHEESIAIFCSFLMDTFDPAIYEHAFNNVCTTHSHVIPTDDYLRHRLAVNRAIAECIGDIRRPLMESLLSWNGAPATMPSSQALLLWVRDHYPQHLATVLSRARALERSDEGEQR
jgi:hypothetical protein